MSISISPLQLLLDDENPRFVVLNSKEQSGIRKYLVTYEDVCDLANSINNYGGLLPGERIVALKRGEDYIVIEGNRRTCAIQLLLNPSLVPEGFQHSIPIASETIKTNCASIEVDTVPDRNAALALMTKRHIEGVKQWKPFAKKQFFASNFAAGQTTNNLSKITGIRESEIKADIKEYKLFLFAYEIYCKQHQDYTVRLVDLKIDPFLRIFKAKCLFDGTEVRPTDLLRISYDEEFSIHSELPEEVFKKIVSIVFEETTVFERITTRNKLSDIQTVVSLLHSVRNEGENAEEGIQNNNAEDHSHNGENRTEFGPDDDSLSKDGSNSGNTTDGAGQNNNTGDGTSNLGGYNQRNNEDSAGGPTPGGPQARTFFETLSWSNRLSPQNHEHDGLLSAVNELFDLSRIQCGRRKAYQVFPIATGMVLRTAYEQALRLRLIQTNQWGSFMMTVTPRGSFPTLSAMECYIESSAAIKNVVLPTAELRSAISVIIGYSHREFLNANIHNPGTIRVTPESLAAIAQAGMFALIQGIINLS